MLNPHPMEIGFGLISVVTGLFPLLLVAGGVLLYVRTRRPRPPASTHQAVAAAGYDPNHPPAWPVGQWNTQVTPDGSLPLFGGRGVLHLENGWLGFHPEGSTEPAWVVAASSVRVGKNSMFATSEVWLDSEQTGKVQLTVSHEHINQVMTNDLKDLRERRYADEFLHLLHRSGAQVVAG